MKRFSFLVISLFFVLGTFAKAKYVFYFIGDGMGVNQVNAAETYFGALDGKIGIRPLCFPSFPYAAMVNTQSGSNSVTDSAAGGTALATGEKSHNGTLGMLTDMQTPCTSIAQWAHDAGMAVGVTTSVTINHATPAAFYAHVPKRSMDYEIGEYCASSDFDFFAGSDFAGAQGKDGKPSIYELCQQAGYTFAKGYKDYQKKMKKAEKMILIQSDAQNKINNSCLPYAIDRKKGDLTLSDITRAGINFLMSKQNEKDGFFMMIEGGKIDWACHANEPATFIHELADMDDAVRVAYEFYQQHPDETLIVITADHETGGFVMGTGKYEINMASLRYADMSFAEFSRALHKLHDALGNKYCWDEVKKFISQHFGFWTNLELTDKQTASIKKAFDDIEAGKGEGQETLYQKDDALALAVKRVQNQIAKLSWASGGHSNGYVPCFAIGAGADQFQGRIDNTDIPKRMWNAMK